MKAMLACTQSLRYKGRFLCTCLTLTACVGAYAEEYVVPGTANIFGAGHAVPPNPGGSGGGTLPPVHVFSAAPGTVLTFPSITGSISCCPNGGHSAEGDTVTDTDVWSTAGISGIVHQNRRIFLAGVFLDDEEPFNDGSCPDPLATPSLTYPPDDLETFPPPELGQLFFIGDGLTGVGTGSVQRFMVPPTATRLFLGFADAPNLTGCPGAHDDNPGSLSVQLAMTQEIPTVSEWGLVIMGMLVLTAGTLVYARRRPIHT